MMQTFNIVDLVLQGFVFLLVILFFVSLFLFVKRILINQKEKAANNAKLEKKLDKIIELLEKRNRDK